MGNRISVALVLLGLGVLVSCGGGGGGNSINSVINVAGNWQVTVTSTVFDSSGTADGQINQNGMALSGTLTLSGTPCAQTANFAGTLGKRM